MKSVKTIRTKLSNVKKQLRKLLLHLSVLCYTNKTQRSIILELYKFIKKHDKKTANDYYFQSLNSLISLKKYAKLGYRDGLDRMIKTKKSDTVFILGSGPSINEIDDNGWKHINKHDSWGFNFWFLHEFVPTHYITQSTPVSELDRLMADLYLSRAKEYREKKCEFFVRGDNVNYFRFHKSKIAQALSEKKMKLKTLCEHFIIGDCIIKPDKLINKMYNLGCFGTKENKNIPKYRSTVCFMISLALMAGYKKIILCGIDMSGNGHFYDKYEKIKVYKYSIRS